MPPISDVIAFAIASFLIIIIPGPSVLFTIGRGISYGKKAALVNVAGNSVGMFIGSLGVAIGIGTFVQSSDIAYALVGVLGGGYLVYLGYDAYRTRKDVAQALVSKADPKPMGQLFKQGFVVGFLNPKSLVFFAAVLPQFVDPKRGQIVLQMIFLAVIFFVIAVLSDGTWGIVAGTARNWLAGTPTRIEKISGAGGFIFIALGVS
ncbi:MAG: LysE family translocator, partial [Candidatus Nanopelagicales bacterium]|nr:LysE family translocator [Candidatus Nanopelagicales bacterium]